jgi:DNA polymerase I-like protein with 3'-5' exonuclease and polymerase domains
MPDSLRTTIVQSIDEFNALVKIALKKKRVGYDVEASGLRPERGARICGYGIGLGPTEGFYVPVRHERAPDVAASEYDALHNMDPAEVADALRPLLESNVPKTGANLAFDTKLTAVEDIRIDSPRDVQALIRILLPKLPRVEGERGPYGLKALKQSVLKEDTGERDELRDWLVGHGLDEHAVHLAPIGIAGVYCIDDATAVLRLADKVRHLAIRDAKAQRKRGVDPTRRGAAFLWRLENDLIPVIAEIESTGFPIDTKYLEQLYDELADEEKVLEEKITELAGREINPRSGPQVAKLVYEDIGLPCLVLTKTKKPATSADALKLSRLGHETPVPVVDAILDCRLVSKLRTTYVRGKKGHSILENAVDGRVFGELRPDGAKSGRFSAANPNLTNIPKRKSEKVRHGFWSGSKEYTLVSFDQSQVEPRLLAHYSRAPSLINAFVRGFDVYKQMGVDAGLASTPDEVDKKMRRLMKTFVLGLNYRMGPKSLARKMTLENDAWYSEDDARDIMNTYFSRVPEVRAFHKRCDTAVERRGFISTMFGRYRYLVSDKSFIGTNHVIQGSAAELFKIAMVKFWRALRGWRSKILTVIHDDIVALIHKSEMRLIPMLSDCLTQYDDFVKLRVPMEANVTIYDTDPDGRWIGGRELTLTEILDAELAAMQDRVRDERERSGLAGADEKALIEMEKHVAELTPSLFESTTALRAEVGDGWRRGESAREFVDRIKELEGREFEVIERLVEV